MVKPLHYLTLALVLAAQTGDASCQDTGAPGYSCHVLERGLQLQNGRVTDVIRNWCDVGLWPQSQTFIAWIQSRRNPDDRWLTSGRSSPSSTVPDQDGIIHTVSGGHCQADIEYAAAWRASGVDHNGVPFDTGIVQRIPGRTDLC